MVDLAQQAAAASRILLPWHVNRQNLECRVHAYSGLGILDVRFVKRNLVWSSTVTYRASVKAVQGLLCSR